MDFIIYILPIAAMILVIFAVAKYIDNPFQYPYFDKVFDVTGKRNPDIMQYIQDWLENGGWSQVKRHDARVEAWKNQISDRIAHMMFFKRHRMRQFTSVLDESSRYRFYFSRTHTKYKQVNRQKYAYKAVDSTDAVGMSSKELRDMVPLLFMINDADMDDDIRREARQNDRRGVVIRDRDMGLAVSEQDDQERELREMRDALKKLAIQYGPFHEPRIDIMWQGKNKSAFDRKKFEDIIIENRYKIEPQMHGYAAMLSRYREYIRAAESIIGQRIHGSYLEQAVEQDPGPVTVHVHKFYVTPKKRNRTEANKVFDGASVTVLFKRDDERIEYEKTEKYRRKMERARITDSVRFNIMARDGFRCQICGREQADGVKLVVDHIKPIAKGGTSDMDNLWTLCEVCNSGKSDKWEELVETEPVAAPVQLQPPVRPVQSQPSVRPVQSEPSIQQAQPQVQVVQQPATVPVRTELNSSKTMLKK